VSEPMDTVLANFAGCKGLRFDHVRERCGFSENETAVALQGLANQGKLKGQWMWGGIFDIEESP
jgi:hypothetical protein